MEVFKSLQLLEDINVPNESEEENRVEAIDCLTHFTDDEGNIVPSECSLDTFLVDNESEEETIKFILEHGFKVFRIFPGETMGSFCIVTHPEFSIEDNIVTIGEQYCGVEEELPFEEVTLVDGKISESKIKIDKSKRIVARDPNAQAMWGRTRSTIEAPKKGKGSIYKRDHSKIDIEDESLLTESPAANFATMDDLPLLIWYEYESLYDRFHEDAEEEVEKRIESGEDLNTEEYDYLIDSYIQDAFDKETICVLDEQDEFDLQQDIDEFNDEHSDIEDVCIEYGYYDGKQLYISGSRYLRPDELDSVAEFFYTMKEKYHLSEMSFRGLYGGYTLISNGQGEKQIELNPESGEELDEDTIKLKDGKWTNKGEEGTHGSFKTKKAADAQRRAMFANGYHEDITEGSDVGGFIMADDEEYKEFDEMLSRNNFNIESKREYSEFHDSNINSTHYQIRSSFAVDTEQEFYDVCDKMFDEIEDFNNKHHLHITANFGWMNDHTITAGLDVRGKYYDEKSMVTLESADGKPSKNELKSMAKHNKKTDKKGAQGWFTKLNAGNVEHNVAFFNHAMGSDTAGDTGSSAGGEGGGMAEALESGEEVDLTIMSPYDFFYEPLSVFVRKGYSWEDDNHMSTKEYWYHDIPEHCMRVSRETYKANKLLRKNKEVMNGVTKFFDEHKHAKFCIIACRDKTRNNRLVNTYRVLLGENVDKSKNTCYNSSIEDKTMEIKKQTANTENKRIEEAKMDELKSWASNMMSEYKDVMDKLGE